MSFDSAAEKYSERIEERLSNKISVTFQDENGICNKCKTPHDVFDNDTCLRVLHIDEYDRVMRRRAETKRANEAFRRKNSK